MKSLLILCNHCKTLLMSKYSGQYLSCTCGKCMVDQTEHYTRYGGAPDDFQSFEIEVDWTKTKLPFARKIDTFGGLSAFFAADALRQAREASKRRGKKAKKSNSNLSGKSKAQKMVRARNPGSSKSNKSRGTK